MIRAIILVALQAFFWLPLPVTHAVSPPNRPPPPGCPAEFNTELGRVKMISDDGQASSVLAAGARNLLANASKQWPLGVGVIVNARGRVLSSAALISYSYAMTTAHGFAGSAALTGAVLALGYANEMVSSGEPGEGVVATWPGVRCFALDESRVLASSRGHLDYYVIALRNSSELKSYGYEPLPASLVADYDVNSSIYMLGMLKDDEDRSRYQSRGGSLPRGADNERKSSVTEAQNERYVSGVALFGGGKFRRLQRYTKDAGTSMPFDYSIVSERGHSGAAILDGRGRWVALHQRDLNRAKCDTYTPWHPYVAEHYHDEFAGLSIDERASAACRTFIAPGNSLPRQGSTLLDISASIHEKVGSAWMCQNIPQMLALLHAGRNESGICGNDQYVEAKMRLRLESVDR